MVDGIGEGFFEGLVWEVEEALGFGPVRVFDHPLAQEAGLDEGKGLTQHPVQGATENLLFESVTASSIREINNINLSLGEKPERFLVEEEEPDIAGEGGLGRTVHDLHLAAKGLEVHLRGGAVKVAADGPEKRADQA